MRGKTHRVCPWWQEAANQQVPNFLVYTWKLNASIIPDAHADVDLVQITQTWIHYWMPETVCRRVHVALDAAAFLSFTQALMEQEDSAHTPFTFSTGAPPCPSLFNVYLIILMRHSARISSKPLYLHFQHTSEERSKMGMLQKQWTWGNLNKFARRHLNKTSLSSPASFRQLWCWVLSQLRKCTIENSNSKLACFEPSQGSWLVYAGGSLALLILGQPSEEPAPLCGAHLAVISLLYRLTFLTPSLASLSALPIMFPECSLSSRAPLPQGSLADVIYATSFASVRKALPDGSTRQPECSCRRPSRFAHPHSAAPHKSVTRDDADARQRHASAARDHFKKNAREHETRDFCSKAIWHGVTTRLCPAEIPLL